MTLSARLTLFLILSAVVLMGQGVVKFALSDGRLPPDGGTVQSPFGSSQQAVSPAPPLQSLSQGEVR